MQELELEFEANAQILSHNRIIISQEILKVVRKNIQNWTFSGKFSPSFTGWVKKSVICGAWCKSVTFFVRLFKSFVF